jgi:hypothetical protein
MSDIYLISKYLFIYFFILLIIIVIILLYKYLIIIDLLFKKIFFNFKNVFEIIINKILILNSKYC